MGASGASHTSGAVVQRRVGGITAACVLISNVIGSGIFTTTGFMARDLGDPGLILLLWLIGALLALTWRGRIACRSIRWCRSSMLRFRC